jgi:small subunit ribosomal protein S17
MVLKGKTDKEKAEKTDKAEKKASKAPRKAAAEKPAVAQASAENSGQNALQRRQTLTGVVVSDKMQKTIVVRVERRVRHGLYGKYLVRAEKYKAHDEKNTAKSGDLVKIIQSRPLSRDKRWVLQEILRKGNKLAQVEVV